MFVHELYYKALEETPHKLAIVCQQETVTYLQLHQHATRFAASLTKLGVKPGDRVGLFMQNIPQYVELFLACSKIGAIVVNVSCYSSTPAIAFMLNHSRAEWLFYGIDLHAKAEELLSEVGLLKGMYVVDAPAQSESSSWIVDGGEELVQSDYRGASSDPFVIIYTSGSTSKPKGAVHTHYSMTHCAIDRVKTLNITSEDSYLTTAYLCHAAAFMVTLLPMLYAGGTALFPRTYTIDNFMHLLVAYAPTMAASGPEQLREMMEHSAMGSAPLKQFRYFSCGGDVVPVELHRRFSTVFNLPLSESIGMTECSTYLTTPCGTEHRMGSMGKPVVGAEVRLVDSDGNDVPTGECGEIIVKARTNMKEYWDDPEATATTIRNGWIYTGDLGRCDDNGYFYFAGRKKLMLVRNTVNISPLMLETTINKHPAITNSCVIGVPDERVGQRVVVFYEQSKEIAPKPTADELTQWVATQLYEHVCPDEWIRLDQLPATAIGKIDRSQLLNIYNTKHASDVD